VEIGYLQNTGEDVNILLLEDKAEKQEKIKEAVLDVVPSANIRWVTNWYDYSRQIIATKFDLILLDLLVPRSAMDPLVEDHHSHLVETTRDFESKSFRTPAIVLTQYLKESEEYFRSLNKVDINVISFDPQGEWKQALKLKIHAAQPKAKFEFVIICALEKEVMAYESVVDSFGKLQTISGLLCREVSIADLKGVIVQGTRMGIVTGAVTASLAIERFEPRLVCMSGICGGVPQESAIYDLLITDVCHQHDVGKWSDDGFKSEHYDVQIDVNVRNKLEELKANESVRKLITENLGVKRSEYPEGMEEINAKLRIVATSSGSAVLAETGKTASLSVGQRKLAGFDMEVFSVYEAARLATGKPIFFATKAVVDDGDKNKGDRFHRVGCLMSAKFVTEAIRRGIVGV
jgi:nucleoside phosphorylase